MAYMNGWLGLLDNTSSLKRVGAPILKRNPSSADGVKGLGRLGIQRLC